MAGDKRKVVVQSDNKTRHSQRQKRARPLVQIRSGVVISDLLNGMSLVKPSM